MRAVNVRAAEVFGHDAVIWSSANITYVLVGTEPRATLEALAKDMAAGCDGKDDERKGNNDNDMDADSSIDRRIGGVYAAVVGRAAAARRRDRDGD